MNERSEEVSGMTFDPDAIKKFAAEMQASTGDDLGPMIWRDVQRLADGYEQLLRCIEAPSDEERRTPPYDPEASLREQWARRYE